MFASPITTLRKVQREKSGVELEKCHFMVKKGIVLGHVISDKGIEVDKAKVDLISNLSLPRTVRD